MLVTDYLVVVREVRLALRASFAAFVDASCFVWAALTAEFFSFPLRSFAALISEVNVSFAALTADL